MKWVEVYGSSVLDREYPKKKRIRKPKDLMFGYYVAWVSDPHKKDVWQVFISYEGRCLDAKQARKLAAWLTRAATWIEQENKRRV